jgi:hypothetical protein
MKTKEAALDSELEAGAGTNGNGQNHTLTEREASSQSAYEAGLASGREAGYRQGYQAGFADGYKQTQGVVETSTAAGAKAKAGEGRAKRLRGLPCAHCGVSLFSDETFCRSCGTPKSTQASRSKQPS